MKNSIKNQNGAIAIISLLVISVFALAMMTTVNVMAASELKMSGSETASEKTFYAAEAGINEALYKLTTNPVPEDFSIDIDGVDVQITFIEEGFTRIIQSQATDLTGKIRTLQIVANASSFAGGFDYAVQGGNGGVYLDPNSWIVGKVYSNSSIVAGNNARVVSGKKDDVITPSEVWVADTNTLNNVDILNIILDDNGNIVKDEYGNPVIVENAGNAHANNILDSTIDGHAYYQTIDGNYKVHGSSSCTNNNYCHPNSNNPEPKLLPISDSDVQKWKDEITNTGSILDPNPSECPNAYISGTFCVTTNSSIGNTKINGNMYIGRKGETGDGATLTLTGNIWVTGNIIFDNNVNNGKAKIDPSLGPASATIITDGIVNVENNYPLEGSGDPKSFLLVLSISTNGISSNCSHENSPAIYASNNSSTIIFAAIHGMLKVKNNGSLNAAAIAKLCLENGSHVIYNPNLTSFVIPGGGGDEVGVSIGTWREQ